MQFWTYHCSKCRKHVYQLVLCLEQDFCNIHLIYPALAFFLSCKFINIYYLESCGGSGVTGTILELVTGN